MPYVSAPDGDSAVGYLICMPYMYIYTCMPDIYALYVCPMSQLPMEILRWAIIAAAFVISLKFITRNVRNVVISQV